MKKRKGTRAPTNLTFRLAHPMIVLFSLASVGGLVYLFAEDSREIRLPWILWLLVPAIAGLAGFVCWRTARENGYDTVNVGEGSIGQRRFGREVAKLSFADVKEYGLKWRCSADLTPAPRFTGDDYYFVYFSDHTMTEEERMFLATGRDHWKALPGVVYFIDCGKQDCDHHEAGMDAWNMQYRPALPEAARQKLPVFQQLCRSFTETRLTESAGCYWADGKVHRMPNVRKDPALLRQLRQDQRRFYPALYYAIAYSALWIALLFLFTRLQ